MVSGPPTTATASEAMPTRMQRVGSTAICGTARAIDHREQLAHQRAKEERGEEKAAAEAGAQRNDRGARLQRDQEEQGVRATAWPECRR